VANTIRAIDDLGTAQEMTHVRLVEGWHSSLRMVASGLVIIGPATESNRFCIGRPRPEVEQPPPKSS
jgi:hypothetical protein